MSQASGIAELCNCSVSWENVCYTLKNEALTFESAAEDCQLNGGHLAAIKTEAVLDHLTKLLENQNIASGLL